MLKGFVIPLEYKIVHKNGRVFTWSVYDTKLTFNENKIFVASCDEVYKDTHYIQEITLDLDDILEFSVTQRKIFEDEVKEKVTSLQESYNKLLEEYWKMKELLEKHNIKEDY